MRRLSIVGLSALLLGLLCSPAIAGNGPGDFENQYQHTEQFNPYADVGDIVLYAVELHEAA